MSFDEIFDLTATVFIIMKYHQITNHINNQVIESSKYTKPQTTEPPNHPNKNNTKSPKSWTGLSTGPVSTGSTSLLAEGARIPGYWQFTYVPLKRLIIQRKHVEAPLYCCSVPYMPVITTIFDRIFDFFSWVNLPPLTQTLPSRYWTRSKIKRTLQL